MICIVNKIGDGSEANPFRPDTVEPHWQVVEDLGSEYLVNIINDINDLND